MDYVHLRQLLWNMNGQVAADGPEEKLLTAVHVPGALLNSDRSANVSGNLSAINLIAPIYFYNNYSLIAGNKDVTVLNRITHV